MQTVKLNNEVIEDFNVTDNYHLPVLNLNIGNFDLKIYNNAGQERTSTVNASLQELGNGNYRLVYTPDTKGIWSTIIKHQIYFPYGKGNCVNVIDYDINDIGDMIKRMLGLTQENYYLYNNIYDQNNNLTNGKIRIYSNSGSVGTINDIIAEYNITATYVNNNLETYSVTKI